MSTYAVESARLYLQALNPEEHFDLIHALNTNVECMKWSSKAISTDPAQTRQLIQESLPTPEKPWNERWVILLKDTAGGAPKPIGWLGMPREQEIGYKILPEFWGKGYMSEALALFIEMFWSLDRNKKYNELLAGADPENIGSLRVLEKQGFKRTVLMKDHMTRPYLASRGESGKSDIQMMQLLRPGTTA